MPQDKPFGDQPVDNVALNRETPDSKNAMNVLNRAPATPTMRFSKHATFGPETPHPLEQ